MGEITKCYGTPGVVWYGAELQQNSLIDDFVM